METLYRKVAVSERMPDKSGFYFTYSSSGVKKTIWFMNDKFSYVSPSYNPEFWLEEIPDNEIKLQKNKEEFAIQILKKLKTKLDNMGMWSYCDKTAFDEEIESLIQKHKS